MIDLNSPMGKLFICLILDSIKELPEKDLNFINKMDLKKVFQTDIDNWKTIIKQVLNLSSTIEIAIKDLWLKNSKMGYENYDRLSPHTFACLFIEQYYKEDSNIDKWANLKELDTAKKNISKSYLK